MSISIIVPVLNESPQIRPFLRHLRARAPNAELIVVDGGSDDETPELGREFCDHFISTERSRPAQMNAGVRVARHDVIWFLHADNEVPEESCEAIAKALSNQKIVGGCFRVRIPRTQWTYRIHDGLAHYVGRLLRVRCGDHGIFVRREVFEKIGGYRDVPLMEDALLFRAMQEHGRVSWLPQRLLLSCRRHEQIGVYRYTCVCSIIVALFCLGVSPQRLARVYGRLVPSRHSRGFRLLAPVEPELFEEFRIEHESRELDTLQCPPTR